LKNVYLKEQIKQFLDAIVCKFVVDVVSIVDAKKKKEKI